MEKHFKSTEAIEEFIRTSYSNVRLIPYDDLTSQYGSKFVIGWQFKYYFQNDPFKLRLLLPPEYPYKIPTLALDNTDSHLVWPHVEVDGTICLWSQETSVDSNKPVQVVQELLLELDKYFKKIKTGQLDKELSREFSSYWSWGATPNSKFYLSLLPPNQDTGIIYKVEFSNSVVIGPTKEIISDWIKRHPNYSKAFSTIQFERAIYINIPDAPIPPYSTSPLDFIKKHLPENDHAWMLIKDSIAEASDQDKDFKNISIAFGCNVESGFGIAVIEVKRAPLAGYKNRKYDPVLKGFRRGKVPNQLLLHKSWGAGAQYFRNSTVRVDYSWVHGRDSDPFQNKLHAKKVLLIGCGSLGSGIAALLAKSGVGSLIIMDGQNLEYSNISRHELGAGAVGKNKADMMSKTIEQQMPHMKHVRGIADNFQRDNDAHLEIANSCDLIITSTGNWGCDNSVSDLQQSNLITVPVMYTWLEGHALAGHAVIIDKKSGDNLLTGFDSVGNNLRPILSWATDQQTHHIPACGGHFMPYGASSLAHSHAFIADFALAKLLDIATTNYRVFIHNKNVLDSMQASISQSWLDAYGPPSSNSANYEIQW